MVTSKIKSIQGNGTWESKHGLMYANIVEMEDGTILKANSKSQQPPYKVGDEVEYHVQGENSYGKWGKVKLPDEQKPQGKSYGGFSPEKDAKITRQSCIKAAAEWCAGQVDTERYDTPLQVIAVAQMFANWCETGDIVDQPEAKYETPNQEPHPVDEDNLTF